MSTINRTFWNLKYMYIIFKTQPVPPWRTYRISITKINQYALFNKINVVSFWELYGIREYSMDGMACASLKKGAKYSIRGVWTRNVADWWIFTLLL